MFYRINKDTSSLETLEETAQELRYFEKHVEGTFERDGDALSGFLYACELFEKMINEKIKALERDGK